MIPVTIHYANQGSEAISVRFVPSRGQNWRDSDGRLWCVNSIMCSAKAVDIFCLPCSPRLQAELEATWGRWTSKEESPCS